MTVAAGALDRLVEERLAERTRANAAFFAAEADRIARLCHRCAERFARGGRLLAAGGTPAARSDARHVAVEFVHPVIVGKRALPALALEPEDVALAARPEDMVIGFGGAPLGGARAQGCLTIAFDDTPGAEWAFLPPTDDAFVAQELAETLYHLVWELVHVFFEHRGLLEGRTPEPRHDGGAASFLYPFLDEAQDDLDAVLADVGASVRMKAQEVGALRERTLTGGREVLLAAAGALRAALDAGGTVLTLGNGGSATDAMDLVADLRTPPADRGWPARRALDLGADPAILTALANGVGPQVLFSRQVIAYARPGDALVAFSTSGGSENVLHALTEARRRGLATVAIAGYDGGRVAADGLADHIIIAPSQHIPRVQEAQASVAHLLRHLLEVV